MLQTIALANQNEGTLFNSDFARGYASHGLGATSLTVKKGTIKKITTYSVLYLCTVALANRNKGALPYGNFVLSTQQWYF